MRCIDFFCGGGGMTTAAVQAGLEPVFVANRDERALGRTDNDSDNLRSLCCFVLTVAYGFDC